MPDLKAVPFDPKKKVRVKMPVSCRCRAERRYQEEQMLQQDKDMRAMEALKRQSLMDERLRDVSFDSFRKTNNNAYNLKLCLRYANHFDEMLAKNQNRENLCCGLYRKSSPESADSGHYDLFCKAAGIHAGLQRR